MSSAYREVSHRPATHEAICVEARRAWQKTYDLKRKANEAQENLFFHREHARADFLVNKSLGALGYAVKDAATATHSLTFGIPDR